MSDAIGAELAQLAREIWDWQRETFGDGCTVHGAVAKIRDECGEVLAAHADGEGVNWMEGAYVDEQRREELADVFFMLVQLAGACGCLYGIERRRPDAPRSIALAYALGMVEAFAVTVMDLHCMGRDEEVAVSSARDAWLDACHANDDLPHMSAAIRAKLEENRSRTWGKPAADGTISHVKPAPKGGAACQS